MTEHTLPPSLPRYIQSTYAPSKYAHGKNKTPAHNPEIGRTPRSRPARKNPLSLPRPFRLNIRRARKSHERGAGGARDLIEAARRGGGVSYIYSIYARGEDSWPAAKCGTADVRGSLRARFFGASCRLSPARRGVSFSFFFVLGEA